MPTVLRVGPYRFFFFSNEGHEPRHIHIESGEGYAKFWVQPVALARSGGYDPAELNRIRKIVEEHRSFFVEKWNEYFGG